MKCKAHCKCQICGTTNPLSHPDGAEGYWLRAKKDQLRALKAQQKKTLERKHTWGDFNLSQSIKQLQGEITRLEQKIASNKQSP